MNYVEKIKEAAAHINYLLEEKGHEGGEMAIVLGSGLGRFVDSVEKLIEVPYEDIPNFPVSTVVGHSGRLILAREKNTGRNFWIMQGRVHYYEGYTLEEVTFPMRLFALMGLKKLIVTNAAGGVNRYFDAGELMIIRDHLNFMGVNPLRGKNLDEFGTRFPDMSEPYSKNMSYIIKQTALSLGVDMKEGIYCAVSGPSFETPAEVRMLGTLGADAVGMSTVPEVIVARHSGIEVAGISFISNKAAGLSHEELTHEEVTRNARMVEEDFARLLNAVTERFLREA